MQLSPPGKHTLPEDDAPLEDERWLLTQRVVRSKGFQRAAQLRAILAYAAKFAIVGNGEPLREDDLAREVLGRRADFDPAYDNIVRVQVSHLRRKLAEYFAGEGSHETMVIHIPKGSYLPHFEPAANEKAAPPLESDSYLKASDSLPSALHETLEPAAPPAGLSLKLARTKRRALVWGIVAIVVACGIATLALRKSIARSSQSEAPKIFLPMVEQGSDVAIVLPDTSLMVIQQILNTEIDPLEYIASDFPRAQLDKVRDPQLHDALMFLGTKRTTSFREAEIALDWVESLHRAGLHGVLRYSRDLHVRDLNGGNVILIGSRRSNPWVSMLTSRTNFQYLESDKPHVYSFINTNPLPGEEKQYHPHHVDKSDINYVDVALVRNFGEKGFVLLIDGSDTQANESATRFLLHGKLPAAIEDQLTRKDFNGLEIFLRGAHLDSESNDKFEIVAYRTQHG